MTRSTVRVSHRLPLVFFVVSELKHCLPLAFIARKRFDFSEQWFLFFPNLIKYKEKESRVVLSVKMVSQHQSKDSGSKKNGGKELGMVTPQEKSSKKMKFASSSAETEPTSRQQSLMIQSLVESSTCGHEMGSNPKDIKEQIWEAVDIAFVVGQGGKNSVLASAAKKWKDFKSTLTRHYILPYTNDRERLSQPPETYKFIEKAQWDAFVASRLSKDFESVHSQHAQIREKLEYNHRLSRKGYAGLEDQLEETMPGVEIDRSTLWKRARQDKHGNIPDPKVAEKAKLICVSGSNDVLTMALGPEHPGRVRGVGAGISPRQYFNLPKPQRMSFDDRLKDSLRVLLQEENKKMEAKAREEALRMEARTKQLVEAEREHFLSQLSQLIPNFDPSMLKPRISQSPKNPMSDKASCSGGDVRSLHFEDDTAKNGKHQEEKMKRRMKKKKMREEEEKKDEEKERKKEMKRRKKMKKSMTTRIKTLNFTIDKEVFGLERDTFVLPEDITQFAGMEEIGATVVAVYMRYLHDLLKQANMCSMLVPTLGHIADRSRLVAARLQKLMPSLILLIVRAKRETVYFLDPLPGNRVVDEEAKTSAGRKAVIWKTLSGTPKQPSSVECGYYVMRFMRDIIMDPSLAFEKKYAKGNRKRHTPKKQLMKSGMNGQSLFAIHMELLNT
ncbi:hypothetical protein Prudu_126S000400 [Prunus dulcis]|uniref:Ubiquitin-like protease family profile domain-containing protein n=1 Tax=Prunus dulcis TaxID=3755 RepID=A0A5H2XTX4_PRUDU|nr:hypothetical protein Prudu_126S000400 [Prunus dulcis]